jgi:hypothetical protein
MCSVYHQVRLPVAHATQRIPRMVERASTIISGSGNREKERGGQVQGAAKTVSKLDLFSAFHLSLISSTVKIQAS